MNAWWQLIVSSYSSVIVRDGGKFLRVVKGIVSSRRAGSRCRFLVIVVYIVVVVAVAVVIVVVVWRSVPVLVRLSVDKTA